MFTLLFACTAPLDVALTAELDETIATVVHVQWSTAEPTVGWIEFGPDTNYTHKTPILNQATEHSAVMLGIPASATWHYRAAIVSAGDVSYGEDHTITVGAPEGLPTITRELAVEHQLWGNYTLVSWWSIVSEESFVALLDTDGAVVWWWELDDGYAMSARFDDARTALIVMLAGLGSDEDAQIARVPLDGTEPTYYATPGAHHDLVLLGDTIAYIAGDPRQVDGQYVVGDSIREIRPDGVTTEVWNAFDDGWPTTHHPGWDQDPVDWTHANGLVYDADNDAWVVSMYWDQSVAAISRETRQPVWKVGGDGYRFADEEPFGPQHAPLLIEGRLGVFDNASDGESSRLALYALDHATATAELTWEWRAPAGTSTRLMGNWHPLPGGGVISGWGEREEVVLIDDAGVAVETLTMDAYGLIGQVQRTDGLYPVDAVFAE
jgi:hypothetical protein